MRQVQHSTERNFCDKSLWHHLHSAMLWIILCTSQLFLSAQALKYDYNKPKPDDGYTGNNNVNYFSIYLTIIVLFQVRSGNLAELRKLFQDWRSLTTKPGSYFVESVENLFKDQIKEEKRTITDAITGDIEFGQFTFYGFANQFWNVDKGVRGYTANDQCTYTQNNTIIGERYYGVFGVELESFESRIILTVNGVKKQCDVIGLTKRRNFRNLRFAYMYINFDYAYVWNPPIEAEIKEWRVNKVLNNPRFNVFVDPKCVNLPDNKIKYLNLALQDHLHRSKILNFVSEIMKEHFKAWVADPYGRFKTKGTNKAEEIETSSETSGDK